MMKLKHIFAAVASFLTVLSCSDLAGEKGDYVPFETVVPEICTAGSVLIVQGEFADDVRFFLQKDGEEPRLLTQETDEFFYDKVSAEFRLPKAFGSYVLIIEQGGKTERYPFSIGIADLELPYGCPPGYMFEVKGKGFAADAVMVLEKDGAETVLADTEFGSNSLKGTVPADLAKGSYILSVRQGGSELVLGEKFIVGIYRKFMSKCSTSEFSYSIIYSEGVPGEFISSRPVVGTNNLIISIDGSRFSFGEQFELTVDSGRVVKYHDFELNKGWDWEYDGDYINKATGSNITHKFQYENGSLLTTSNLPEYEYDSDSQELSPNIVDITLLNYAILTGDEPLVFGIMSGMSGKLSDRLPSKSLDEEGNAKVLTYKKNKDGLVTSCSDGSRTYTYEYGEYIDIE